MTWIKFISWLTGLYVCYYVLNIAWDLLRKKQSDGKEAAPELHFEEAATTQRVAVSENKNATPPKKENSEVAASALGGVNVKDLFQLARLELIAYNQSVTF